MGFPIHVSPSILSADPGALRTAVDEAVRAGCQSIHVDVMDGHYVHNFAFGPNVIEALTADDPGVPIVAHLEIARPDDYISDFARAGADLIVVQEDVTPNLPRTVESILAAGAKPGLAINPDRTFAKLDAHPHVLADLSLVIAMGVYPGFAGQVLASTTVANIRRAVALRHEAQASYDVAVDGGVSPASVPGLVQAGANYLIAGSSLFDGDVTRNIAQLRSVAERALDG